MKYSNIIQFNSGEISVSAVEEKVKAQLKPLGIKVKDVDTIKIYFKEAQGEEAENVFYVIKLVDGSEHYGKMVA